MCIAKHPFCLTIAREQLNKIVIINVLLKRDTFNYDAKIITDTKITKLGIFYG